MCLVVVVVLFLSSGECILVIQFSLFFSPSPDEFKHKSTLQFKRTGDADDVATAGGQQAQLAPTVM
jgi:hypothetical protein